MCANVSNWKGFERVVAKAFGTTRAPVCNNVTHSDTFSEKFYVEVKTRKKLGLWALYEDTKKKAEAEHKIPVVALKEKGKRGFLIVTNARHICEIAEQLNLK